MTQDWQPRESLVLHTATKSGKTLEVDGPDGDGHFAVTICEPREEDHVIYISTASAVELAAWIQRRHMVDPPVSASPEEP